MSDTRAMFMLLNHARHRAIHSVFGLPPEQDNILTLMALGLAAGAVHGGYRRVVEAPGAPSGGDVLIGTASLSEVMSGIAGPSSRKAPMLGTLLLAALLAGAAGPAIRGSLRGLKGETDRVTLDFHRRYGYLVDPGHWRQRRAERRAGGHAIAASPSEPAEGTA